MAVGEEECSLCDHWCEDPGPAGGQPGRGGLEAGHRGHGEAGHCVEAARALPLRDDQQTQHWQ